VTTPLDAARSEDAWSAEWSAALGKYWRLELWLIAALLFAAGFSLPLADPDLPMHLATGEWIARHHGVPFVEPFAWTRPGAPFLAYSWAIELAYYEVMVHAGPIGLSVLQGVVYLALAGVMLILGRAAGWNPWVVILMAAGNIIVALGASPCLRPQAILLLALPLTWALVYRAIDTNRLAATLAGLFAVSVVLANTHLLFPLMAAPCVLLLGRMPRERRRILLVPLAIGVGWLVSPYSMHLPEMFRLYFAPNVLIAPPSRISEYKPGFEMLVTAANSSLLVAVLLTMAPWFVAARIDAVNRFLFGALWLGGILLYALAVRSLIVWWVVAIPVAAAFFALFPPPADRTVRTAQRALVLGIFALVAVDGLEDLLDPILRAGDAASRILPSTNAAPIEPLARWIDCNTRPVEGRLVTTFNYGGYVPWRLPQLSESIDGRTFFPDSVARPEAYFVPAKRVLPLQPWRTADLAIFPVSFPVAAVLDTAAGWHRVAMTSELDGPARMIGLWVTDGWWNRAGKIPLPRSVLPVMHSLEPRRATCASLVASGAGN
jgi:hypothetical protein